MKMDVKFQISKEKLSKTLVDKVFEPFINGFIRINIDFNKIKIDKDFALNGDNLFFTKEAANALYAYISKDVTEYLEKLSVKIEKKVILNKKRADTVRSIRNAKKIELQNSPNYLQYLKLKNEKKEKTHKKMDTIIDQYFEVGENPMTCTQICQQIGWDKDSRIIARQLRFVFGKPKHIFINGVQGKYYYLQTKIS